MKPENLEDAIILRDSLNELRSFKKNMMDKEWVGDFDLIIGSYRTKLSMSRPEVAEAVKRTFVVQETKLLADLQKLGVEIE